MKEIFTFIVPVYNVEKYIERCINSLVNQSFCNFEIILVDDGSTDSSSKICDTYASMDQRIKVIHKKNGGLSDARNVGVKAAVGEYIIFVDSDDYIKRNTCERVYRLIKENKKVDIIIGEAKEIHSNKTLEQKHTNLKKNYVYTNKEYIQLSCIKKQFYMPACINVYKREFIITNELYFKKGLLHEDMEWSPRVFLAANEILYLKDPFYFYVIRDGSITQSKNKDKNKKDSMDILVELYILFNNINDINLRNTLNAFLVQIYLTTIAKLKVKKKEDKLKLKFNFMLKNTLGPNDKIKIFLFCLNRNFYSALWNKKNRGD